MRNVKCKRESENEIEREKRQLRQKCVALGVAQSEIAKICLQLIDIFAFRGLADKFSLQ